MFSFLAITQQKFSQKKNQHYSEMSKSVGLDFFVCL